ERGCGVRHRRTAIADDGTGSAWGRNFAFGYGHTRSLFDRLIDKLMAIAFLTTDGNEKSVSLHSPRVIRDAFHFAIKRPDDPTWRNGPGENFELHVKLKRLLNVPARWLKRPGPPRLA